VTALGRPRRSPPLNNGWLPACRNNTRPFSERFTSFGGYVRNIRSSTAGRSDLCDGEGCHSRHRVDYGIRSNHRRSG
jgi:hypothetical protein